LLVVVGELVGLFVLALFEVEPAELVLLVLLGDSLALTNVCDGEPPPPPAPALPPADVAGGATAATVTGFATECFAGALVTECFAGRCAAVAFGRAFEVWCVGGAAATFTGDDAWCVVRRALAL
jgi:hypothetical protein